MNKKAIAILISTTLTLNTFQMAMAQSNTGAGSAANIMDQELSDILNLSDAKSRLELENTVLQIVNIRTQLNNLLVKKSNDKYLDLANKIQAALALISAGATTAHLTKKDQANVTLAVSTASMIVSVGIKHYTKGKNITTEQMSEIVGEATSQILKNTENMTEGMRTAVQSINSINLELQTSRQWTDRMVDKSSDVQDYVALGSAVYLALHYIMPKFTRQTDGLIKKYLPVIQSVTQKGLDATKKTTVGVSGVTSVPDLIGLAFSMGSPEAQETVKATLTKLNNSEIGLKAEMSKIDQRIQAVKKSKAI